VATPRIHSLALGALCGDDMATAGMIDRIIHNGEIVSFAAAGPNADLIAGMMADSFESSHLSRQGSRPRLRGHHLISVNLIRG
jgi:hypothetical protein